MLFILVLVAISACFVLQHEVFVWSLLKRYSRETIHDYHSGTVTCLKITPDGKKLISGNLKMLYLYLLTKIVYI